MNSSAWKECADMHDESLIIDYLRKKMKRPPSMFQQIADLDDIFTVDPWDAAAVDNRSAGKKWFFSRCTGTYDCRTTRSGFWTQIENLELMRDGLIVVEKLTSAFYKGRRPKAKLTEWRMDEYISHYVSNMLKVSSAFCCLYCDPAIQQYATDTSSSVKNGTAKNLSTRQGTNNDIAVASNSTKILQLPHACR